MTGVLVRQRCCINFATNTQGVLTSLLSLCCPIQDAEHTHESLVRVFHNFGGGVKTVLVNNQKAAVLINNNGKVLYSDVLPLVSCPLMGRTKGK